MLNDIIQEIEYKIKEAQSEGNERMVVFLKQCLDNIVTIAKFAD